MNADDGRFVVPFAELRTLCAKPGGSLTPRQSEELVTLLRYYDKMRALGRSLGNDLRGELDEAEGAISELRKSIRHTAELFVEME